MHIGFICFVAWSWGCCTKHGGGVVLIFSNALMNALSHASFRFLFDTEVCEEPDGDGTAGVVDAGDGTVEMLEAGDGTVTLPSG